MPFEPSSVLAPSIIKCFHGNARILDLKKVEKKSKKATGKVKVKKNVKLKSQKKVENMSKKVNHRPQLEKVKKKSKKSRKKVKTVAPRLGGLLESREVKKEVKKKDENKLKKSKA